MLITCWSPKGGSGTSVVAAACAIALADRGARLADLGGDQPAICGVAHDPEVGLTDWLGAGPGAPADALARLEVEVAPGIRLLPRGAPPSPHTPPETLAALGVALRDGPPAIVDLGSLVELAPEAAEAVLEVADVTVLVLRGCYLALRRAVRVAAAGRADAVAFVDERGRSLRAAQVLEVLGRRTLVPFPATAPIARAVDAGVVLRRPPAPLRRAATELLAELGLLDRPERAA